MLNALGMLGLISVIKEGVSQAIEPVAPPIYNFDLYRQDILGGATPKQLHKNQLNGRYARPADYREPIKNERGQIMIMNGELYKKDLKEHGVYQTFKWARNGKYNDET